VTRRPRRVYFIKPVGMPGPIKIGCSLSPDNRRETLETWCPVPLEVVAEIDGGFALERRFHTVFADSYIKHEWFVWTPELADLIEQIKAGAFDVDTLPAPAKLSHFRKPRNNSYITPEWRYRASVCARFRARLSTWPWWNEEFKAIVPATCGDLRPYRDEIEALLERLTAEKAEAA
jgi:hypothetical protein